jgi:glycyl-tRNA synthetase beta chain
MTAMVGEFPELQGTMGRYYALAEGQSQSVASAIEEHYRPRFAGDAIASTKAGQAVALADKIDTLTGIFAIDQRPTGAKDPFGLRRAALGVLRTILDGRLDLDLKELLTLSAEAQPVKRAVVVAEVYDFIAERLRGVVLEQAGNTAEMFDAVLARQPASPLDFITRLDALRSFLTLPEAPVLAAINKRIANILKKTQIADEVRVNEATLSEAAEHELLKALVSVKGPASLAADERRYEDSLRSLTDLAAPINGFFDKVMVMDENAERRSNRLALLRDVQVLLSQIADLSRLPG